MREYEQPEQKRELRRLVEHRPTRAERPTEPGHESVFDLQRQAGNSAVSAMLRELAPNEPGPESNIAVSRDDAAEREADKVADEAVGRLGHDATKTPIVNGTLSPTLRRALGAVAPDVGATQQLRVHTDEAAHRAADSIGARAFTSGRDVSVAKGELRDHREGNRLVAHEAVHAARHQSHDTGDVVHAKLRGTKDALVSQAGGNTSGKVRKLAHSKTNWDKIIAAVGAYEELEAVVLKSGQNPSPTDLAKVTPKMLAQLSKVEAACAAWEKANKDSEGTKKNAAKVKHFEEKGELAESDERSKSERRQAIAMLLPRVRLEAQDLQNGKWIQSLGLSDKQKTENQGGREGKGQMNVVKELNYKTENGEFSGYFKADKGFAKEIQGHEAKVGITQVDPNYGARSVAMYRLDQLLGADVTARAEFAASDGKLGTVLESAKGKAAVENQYALDSEHKQKLGPGAIDLADPVLQRAMNKLQILDAICGQLDRHQGNWYIDADEKTGKVKSVTGIDLDMAFGSEMQSPEMPDAQNFLGMPDMVDEEFAQQILKVKPEDIRNTLKGLLSDKEIESTVSRFTSVRTKIEEVAKKRGLVKQWNEQTAEENRLKKESYGSGHKSYASQVSGNTQQATSDKAKKEIRAIIDSGEGPPPFRADLMRQFDEMPEVMVKAIKDQLKYQIAGSDLFTNAIWSGAIPAAQATDYGLDILNTVLANDSLMSKVIIAIQEAAEGFPAAYQVAGKILQPVVEQLLAQAGARRRSKSKV